ncbi:hypothetical protein GGR50DRAFT_698829 [Xylaria sp. CBS 124048]|nr:hypothetical protein GGR50DRAFT_698829 [Xylaria sp. CBS 124048]
MSVQTVDTEMAEAITQTSASAAYEAIGHTQEPPQPGEQASENERRMETTSFVKFDEAAHIALQKLRTSNIPARLGEPKWPGIAITAQEVSIITQKAIEVGKTNFKTDIRSLMRHALIGGPIQARIEELINDAFCEAGINDRATLSQTIRAIVCDIYDPMEERLSNVTTECDELSDSIKGMQQENEITTSNIGLLFGIIKETDAVTVKIDVFTDMKHQVENLSRKIEDLTENANEDERAINELEGRLRKQEEKNEALSAKLDDLTAKVQENAALTAKLDDLAAKVQENAALTAKLDDLAAKVQENAALTAKLDDLATKVQENAAISAKLDDLAAKVQENADVSAKLDDLLHDNEDIIGRIDDQDEQIQQIEDLAYKFGEIPSKAREREIATIMDKIDDIAEQVEEYDDLSVKINDISVRVQEYDTVATKVNGIASRVDRHDTIIKDFTTAQQTDLTLTSPHDADDVDEFGRPKNFWA